MNKANNLIPFPTIPHSNTLNIQSQKKNFNIQLSISLPNIACLESSNPNRVLKTAIDLHRQLDSIGFLQMTQSNQSLFNSIKKIQDLEFMTLFFPEISNIKPSLQEDLFLLIKNVPRINLFFIFGSSIPFSVLSTKSLLVKDFQTLAGKVIQLDTSLIKILNTPAALQ